MSQLLSSVSYFFIPGILSIVILYGLYKHVSIYDCFIEGAKDGLKSAVEIMPFIIAIFVGIEALVSSGAMGVFESLFSPIFALLHIPKELISLILLRPVSGSGSLVLMERVMADNGVDTYIGKCAAIMVGTCETIFYVLALYFGVTAVKKMRHAFAAGLIGYIVSVLASVYICRLM
ncbi:spore maturation protein [Aminipila luticellarii]|uniref:Spore maturation protein n=1 Tax=Aminipila luticellarii TaxID=2507160 RepID=A0A410PWK5_9FIRM|nr:nucleoside recognition domain-containing protein [Aminipila luticellarii]QAT43328.1 spore maturation protein [Aminipila luticellarii]